MPTVPLSKNLTDFLEEEYKTKTGEGLDDATLAEILQVSMPAIIIFNQIDCDHSGKVSMRELYRLLRALPRNKPIPPEGGWPNGEAPKFVPPEEMIKVFDTGKPHTQKLVEVSIGTLCARCVLEAPRLYLPTHNSLFHLPPTHTHLRARAQTGTGRSA